MLNLDKTLCIGCGECVKDCFPDCIELKDGIAEVMRPENCMRCGHCVAVCPVGAFSDDEWETPSDEGDALLRLMMNRRTVRRFRQEAVPDEYVERILRAGQYSPTACNFQLNGFVVIKGDKSRLQRLAIDTLAESGRALLKNSDDDFRAARFLRWKQDLDEQGENCGHLFFHAPLVIIVTAPETGTNDAAAAAAYMELEANSLGLGALYSGYFCGAANSSSEIRDILGIEKGRCAARCLVIGWPDVRYQRPSPRKPIDVKII